MLTDRTKAIAILGASDNPSRYSYKAYKKLLENNYKNLYGITPKSIALDEMKVFKSIKEIHEEIHTLTFYVSAEISKAMLDDILSVSPRRMIFNPGAENRELENLAREKGIEVLEACTLVLLSTDQF